MQIEKIVHENVRKDGTFSDKLGAVVTDGCIRMSRGEGCDLPSCNCSEGHWVMIGLPLENGKVEIVKVTFDDGREMDHFFRFHELTA